MPELRVRRPFIRLIWVCVETLGGLARSPSGTDSFGSVGVGPLASTDIRSLRPTVPW